MRSMKGGKQSGKRRRRRRPPQVAFNEEQQREAKEWTARAEVLQTETSAHLETDVEQGERPTFRVEQSELRDAADLNVRSKLLDLELRNFAPYRIAWTRSGRHLLLAGAAGHLSVIDALRNSPKCEVHVKETVRDVTFLHDETMFAVAQKKHIFIYNEHGAEVHRLRSHISPSRLEFLRYHFLLVSTGRGGWLKYQDTSTGELVSEHRTKLGPCDVMTQNPQNAIICLGHGNGTVTMWSPSVSKPLVKMFCHGSAVQGVAVDHEGKYLCTAGLDGKLSIWDVRNYKRLHSYFTPRPATSLEISQTGFLSATCGYQVQIWKDAFKTKQSAPYMQHQRRGDEILQSKWRPFEDILGLGHTSGFQSILVPGAGFANYDAFEANPFETGRQRNEAVVHRLLEKIQPDMIVLNNKTIGSIAGEGDEEEPRESPGPLKRKEKNKMKGRSKIGAKLKRKHRNIIYEERDKLREKLEQEQKASSDANQVATNQNDALTKRFKRG